MTGADRLASRQPSSDYSRRMDADGRLDVVRDAVAHLDGLRLLVLHGSRSRGDEHARSDWDFGYQGDARLDPATLHVALTQTLGTEQIDLTDLDRASGLLRIQVAQRGRSVYEHAPDAFEAFVLAAALFWCDAEPVIRRAHEAVLAELPSR